MTTETTPDNGQSFNRYITSRGIIITGWFLLILICVIIVTSTLYLMVSGNSVPETLLTWTSTVLGFLFGTFISLIKEFMNSSN